MNDRRAAWFALFLLALAAAVSRPARLAAQEPALADLLAKARERAAALVGDDRLLLCEERYKQKLEKVRAIVGFEYSGPGGSRSEVTYDGVDQREWLAELVLAATPGSQAVGYPWMEFRDVIAVNGKPRGNGSSRLGILASDTAGVATARALEISQSSASLLFGRMARAVDVPREAALFLHPLNQVRFEFKKGGRKKIEGVQALEVKFEEKQTPTIVRGSGDKDAPSRGSLWIDPATGNLLMSLLKSADSSSVYDELTVTYRLVPEIGATLPAEAAERIVDEETGTRVVTATTFSKWRAVVRK